MSVATLLDSYFLKLPVMTEGTPCRLNPAYHVFKVPPYKVKNCPLKNGCPQFWADCTISFKLTPASAKKYKREFSAPLAPYPRKSPHHVNRWDLKIALPANGAHESVYTRAVGFTLLKFKDKKGRTFSVKPSQLSRYQVDHKKSWELWNSCISNLQILTKSGHKTKTKLDLLKRPAARQS